MKKCLVPIFVGALALGIYAQPEKSASHIERTEISTEEKSNLKNSGDYFIFSAREDLESALLRASQSWKWRQSAVSKVDYLNSNNITTNLSEYVSIAVLRHNAAVEERNAGFLVLGVRESIRRARKIYLENEIKERLDPPVIDEYLDPKNCFLRAEGDIKSAIENYELGEEKIGEAVLRQTLGTDARQRAEEYLQKARSKSK